MFAVRPTLLLAFTCAVAISAATTPLGAQGAAQLTYTDRPLTPGQVRTDVAVLRRALEEVHSGYDRYTPRRVMDTAFARLDRRAAEPMTELELYREVALLLAKIRCNHTKAEYPAAFRRYRQETPTHVPLRVRIFGTKMYVALSAGNRIARGTEIVQINGHPVTEVIAKLSRYAAVDGYTDFARTTLLADDSDLMGSDLDQYWPMEYGIANQWTFVVRAASGATSTVTMPAVTFAGWDALDGDTGYVDFRNGTSVKQLDDTTALLTIRSFVNYRTPINADSLYTAIFTALGRSNTTHLILDLRENGGGSSDASDGLLRYLANAPVTPLRGVRRRTILIDSTLAAAFDTWGDRAPIFSPNPQLFERTDAGWYVERGSAQTLTPSAVAFRGRVSVLTSEANSSGSTMLMAVLQGIGARTGRLRLVGTETAGSAEGATAGQILQLKLPNSGMEVRIPLKRSDVNADAIVPGLGVFPDVDATESLADFRAGIDRALVTARTMPWRAPSSPLSPTVGLMRGVLEYSDYQGGGRVTLPTWVHLSPIGNTGTFRERTIYDDGPGKTIYSTGTIRIAGTRWIQSGGGEGSDAQQLSVDTMRIVSRKAAKNGEVFVLRGRGMDDNTPVEFRYTVTLGRNVSVRLKEYRTGTEAWRYRHEYRFARVTSVP